MQANIWIENECLKNGVGSKTSSPCAVGKKICPASLFKACPTLSTCPRTFRACPCSHMAAAQNVRSGSSPGPTHDPDLRSRPFERI